MWNDFANFNLTLEVQMRTPTRNRNRFIIILCFDQKEPADRFFCLRTAPLNDTIPLSAQNAPGVVQFFTGMMSTVSAKLADPRHVSLQNLLHFLRRIMSVFSAFQ